MNTHTQDAMLADDELPLKGIRVVDFSRIIAGPFCAQYLADLGAEVVKVERAGSGDEARGYSFPAMWGGTSTMFLSFNRGKRSIALDLDRDADVQLALSLCAQADVVIENFRPGVMDRLGLGYEALANGNARLVYCSISGFGETGPMASRGANDLVAQASCGVMSLNGGAGSSGAPEKVVPAMVDMFTGLNAALAIVAALHRRAHTGRGAQVATSLFESGVSMLSYFATAQFAPKGKEDRPDLGASITVPNQSFRAKDGWMAIACSNEGMWQRLCKAVARPQLANDARFATNLDRTHHQQELIPLLQEAFAERTRNEWVQRLEEAKVSASPVMGVDEVLAHPQTAELGLVREVPHASIAGFRALRAPFRIDGKMLMSRRPPPALDEHHEQIRTETP